MYVLSATSLGSTDTRVWFHDQVGVLFPQKTIYDQVDQAGFTWKVMNHVFFWKFFVREKMPGKIHEEKIERFFLELLQ